MRALHVQLTFDSIHYLYYWIIIDWRRHIIISQLHEIKSRFMHIMHILSKRHAEIVSYWIRFRNTLTHNSDETESLYSVYTSHECLLQLLHVVYFIFFFCFTPFLRVCFCTIYSYLLLYIFHNTKLWIVTIFSFAYFVHFRPPPSFPLFLGSLCVSVGPNVCVFIKKITYILYRCEY